MRDNKSVKLSKEDKQFFKETGKNSDKQPRKFIKEGGRGGAEEDFNKVLKLAS